MTMRKRLIAVLIAAGILGGIVVPISGTAGASRVRGDDCSMGQDGTPRRAGCRSALSAWRSVVVSTASAADLGFVFA
jgi:hypothetical protein